MSYLRIIQFGFWNLASKVMAVVIILAHIAFELGFIFICNPIAKSWDTSITSGSCLGMPFYTAFSSLTIAFDIIMSVPWKTQASCVMVANLVLLSMLLPFHVIVKTQIQTRKKVAILGLFALGTFITVVQVIRFSTIRSLSNLLDSASPITWSIIEGNLGIITTCLPTLAPLMRYYAERSRLEGQSERVGTTGQHGGNSHHTSSSYVMVSFLNGLRGTDTAVERSTVVSGNHSGDSTELIISTTGIIKTTELTVSSAGVDH